MTDIVDRHGHGDKQVVVRANDLHAVMVGSASAYGSSARGKDGKFILGWFGRLHDALNGPGVKKHSHWRHIAVCVGLCLTLHFALEAWRDQRDSAYIADLQEQIDMLCIRLDMQDGWHHHPGPVADSLRVEREVPDR